MVITGLPKHGKKRSRSYIDVYKSKRKTEVNTSTISSSNEMKNISSVRYSVRILKDVIETWM